MGKYAVGQVVGRYTLLEDLGYKRSKTHRSWQARCSCGKEQPVYDGNFASNKGMMCRACAGTLRETHGQSGHRRTSTYTIWAIMKQRCKNPNQSGYAYYGGRGITYCERWERFESFLEDMGARPDKNHSIQRMDNDGNYEPGNCKWATWDEQVVNRRKASQTRRIGKYKAEEIRKLYKDGVTRQELAGQYGITDREISRIVTMM